MSDKTSESPETDPEEPPAKATWISPEKWTAWLKFGLLAAGADKTPDQAAVQARVIAGLVAEFSQATPEPDRQGTVMILDRNGAFRTVVQFGSRSAARAASAEMKSKLKYGGYVREQGGWCPDPTPIDPIEGFESFSCVNG